VNLEKLKDLFNKSWTFSQSNKIKSIINSFSIGEKVAFYVLVIIFGLSALSLLWQVNKNYLVEVPVHGGTLTEGVIGTPRFINPLLALSDPDRDVSSLVYSGLLKQNTSGNLVPDLAQSYTISPDGLTYTFTLKNTIKFSDGTTITADDVVFTIERAQDPGLKSPKEASWADVRIEKIDDRTITFILKQPYAPFIYNTTIGILPKHIWKEVNNDSFPFSALNIKPVGSGPYIVTKVKTDSSGLPIEYDMKANNNYISGEPYITNIIFKFYQNENDLLNAYNNGDVDAINSISPQNINLVKRSGGVIEKAELNRVFGIFFNQNQNPVLVSKDVRLALDTALDKQAIVDSVLGGYGNMLSGPIPDDIDVGPKQSSDERIAKAEQILEKAGWTKGLDGIYIKQDKKTNKNSQILSVSLSTSDAPELKAEAKLIQATWQKLGAKVDVKIFEIGDLNQNIIRPRKYDALLFGEIIKADGILENLRKTSDTDKQMQLEKSFEDLISADEPAVFLYAPDFIYVVPDRIQNIQLGTLTVTSDRFANVSQWYTNTNSVWQIFVK
jgi:peptide/nickel transport system substrate-binding protein